MFLSKTIVPDSVIGFAVRTFRLELSGDHGSNHWMDVYLNGQFMSELTGADKTVVAYFAILHDICRTTENSDPYHGERASGLLAAIRTKNNNCLEELDPRQFGLLIEAISGHSHGTTSDCPTIGTCWDSDRLDLVRYGINPDHNLMSTDLGKEQALSLSTRDFTHAG